MPELCTVGHSNHPIDAFVELLRLHDIQTVADVRSQPASRCHMQFQREALHHPLAPIRIDYLYLCRELGARS
jgi:uncharacterized protein (DUF488 family)